jgi:effector-binding domain-containing protein
MDEVNDGWELTLSLELHTNDEKDIVIMLREIASKIKKGQSAREGYYCAGTYEFQIKPDEKILRSLV